MSCGTKLAKKKEEKRDLFFHCVKVWWRSFTYSHMEAVHILLLSPALCSCLLYCDYRQFDDHQKAIFNVDSVNVNMLKVMKLKYAAAPEFCNVFNKINWKPEVNPSLLHF